MKRKFKPVVGLAVAAMIGTAYAQCYYSVTGVCADTSVLLDVFPLSCGNREVHPKTNWSAADIATTTPQSGQTGRSWTKSANCCGTATYLDCSGHYQDINNWCINGQYQTPDPAASTCSSE